MRALKNKNNFQKVGNYTTYHKHHHKYVSLKERGKLKHCRNNNYYTNNLLLKTEIKISEPYICQNRNKVTARENKLHACDQ